MLSHQWMLHMAAFVLDTYTLYELHMYERVTPMRLGTLAIVLLTNYPRAIPIRD